MHVAPKGSVSRYKYRVESKGGFGYTRATEEALKEIDIDYELVKSNPTRTE